MENVFMCLVGFATIGVMFAVIQGIEAIVRNCVITAIKNAAYKALHEEYLRTHENRYARFRKFGIEFVIFYYGDTDTCRIRNYDDRFISIVIND